MGCSTMEARIEGLHAELTRSIIGAAYEVHGELGRGFLERVYATALRQELLARGIESLAEAPIQVTYKGQPVGNYYADLLVDGRVVCELKAVNRLLPEHEAQLLHYLKSTAIKVGLLINFGSERVQVKRMVFTTK